MCRADELSLLVDLHGSRQPDDVPEDVSHLLVVETRLASHSRCPPNDLRLASRIQRRQPGRLLRAADLLAHRDSPRQQRPQLAVERLDFLAAALQRLASLVGAHAAAPVSLPAEPNDRPAASANAPSRSISARNPSNDND